MMRQHQFIRSEITIHRRKPYGDNMPQEIKLTLTVNSVIDNLDDSGLPDGEPEINIFTTGGTLTLGDAGMRLSFTESENGESTTSTLYLTEEKIILKKRGAIVSDLTFREGDETVSIYRVGPYAFDMTLKTKRIRNSLSPEGGELTLLYAMNVGGQEKNVRMKISARQEKIIRTSSKA